MKGRKQKISNKPETCPQKNRTASDGYGGGQTFLWITENNLTEPENRQKNGLLEDILSPANFNAAYKRVKSNKGAAGVDKMEVESLKDYLVNHKDELIVLFSGANIAPIRPDGYSYPKKKGNSVSWVFLQ